MTEIEQKLEYAIKHEPQRYVVKRWGLIFWSIENLKGQRAMTFYFSKANAQAFCDLLNSAYSLGYTYGQESILKIFYPDKF